MILYYAPDTCALASHIALEKVGADYQLKRVSFARDEQKSDQYLTINPMARVPALVTARGVLTETPAILAFIAQSYPTAGLAPVDDPYEFAQLQAFNSYLCSTVHVAHAHRMRGYRWADDEVALKAMKRKVPQAVADSFAVIEQAMQPDCWLFGDNCSTSDIYLFTLAQWLEADGVDVSLLPLVLAHREKMRRDPAVIAAIAAELG